MYQLRLSKSEYVPNMDFTKDKMSFTFSLNNDPAAFTLTVLKKDLIPFIQQVEKSISSDVDINPEFLRYNSFHLLSLLQCKQLVAEAFDIIKSTEDLFTYKYFVNDLHLFNKIDRLASDIFKRILPYLSYDEDGIGPIDIPVTLITHHDGDGFNCSHIINSVFSNVTLHTWDYKDGEQKLLDLIESFDTRYLFITDISLQHNSVIDLLTTEKFRDKYTIIDHHDQTADYLNIDKDTTKYPDRHRVTKGKIYNVALNTLVQSNEIEVAHIRTRDQKNMYHVEYKNKPSAGMLTLLLMEKLVNICGSSLTELINSAWSESHDIFELTKNISLYDTFSWEDYKYPAINSSICKRLLEPGHTLEDNMLRLSDYLIFKGDIKPDEEFLHKLQLTEKQILLTRNDIPKEIEEVCPEGTNIIFYHIEDIVSDELSLDDTKATRSSVARILLRGLGYDIVAWKTEENEYSFRSHEASCIQALDIAKALGGGGHIPAAGAPIGGKY